MTTTSSPEPSCTAPSGTAEPGSAVDDLRAVVGARRDLGPDYDRVLVQSFVERAEAHLLARLPGPASPVAPAGSPRRTGPVVAEIGQGGLGLAVATVAWGVLSTLLMVEVVGHEDLLAALIVVVGWAGLGLADLLYVVTALGRRRPGA